MSAMALYRSLIRRLVIDTSTRYWTRKNIFRLNIVDLLLDSSTALDPVVFSRNISIVDVITKLLGLTSPSHNFLITDTGEVLPRSITDYQQKISTAEKSNCSR